jgi:hypothetical protein
MRKNGTSRGSWIDNQRYVRPQLVIMINSFTVFMVCKTPTCELNHSSAIQIASSSLLLVFLIALAVICLLGEVNLCRTD